MRTLDNLIADIRREASQAEFPIDRPVYEKAGKNPLDPILCTGSLSANICVFARDLGKDEVAFGQPMVGAGGKLVRRGLIRAFGDEQLGDLHLESALSYALLTNTMPYKPPGNKAYNEKVKARFRPFVAELLVSFWSGDRIISLGNEAFAWFAPYCEPGAAEEFWKREDRYEAELPCMIEWHGEGGIVKKNVQLCPLPHPSPLNAKWYGRFPALLDARLASVP